MFDVPMDSVVVADGVSAAMERDGFMVKGHSLVFTGLCPRCNCQG